MQVGMSNNVGMLQVINPSSLNPHLFRVNYGYTVSQLPSIAVVVASIDVSSQNVMAFSMVVQTIAFDHYDLDVSYGPNSNIKNLFMYTMSKNNTFSYIQLWNNLEFPASDITSVTTGTGSRSATTTYTFPTSDYTVDLTHQVEVLVWLQSIYMDSNGVAYSVSLSAATDTSQTVKLTLTVDSSTTVTVLSYTMMIYDKTALSVNNYMFVDYGVISSTNNQWSSLTISPVWKASSNFIQGLSGIGYVASSTFKFTFTFASGTYTSNDNYDMMQISYWSYRQGSCSTGYAPDPATSNCVEYCGDGTLFAMACDDGNTVNGDGCASNCTIQSGWTCSGGSATSASTCTQIVGPVVPPTLTVVLVYTLKSSTNNSVSFYFQISPSDASLDQVNFNANSVVTCNNSASNINTTYLGQGLVQVDLNYTSAIQNTSMDIVFDLSKSQVSNYTSVPPVPVSFTVQPNNNLAADYYEQGQYDAANTFGIVCIALLCLYLVAFIVGLLTRKYIAVQAIGVAQVAFLGLSLIQNLGPSMGSLLKLKYINGINILIHSSSISPMASSPRKTVPLEYDAPMISTFNCVLIALLLPYLVGLVLYLTSKCKCSQTRKEKLVEYSKMAFYQYGFTAVMFVLYHWTFAFELFLGYSNSSESQLMIASILILSYLIYSHHGMSSLLASSFQRGLEFGHKGFGLSGAGCWVRGLPEPLFGGWSGLKVSLKSFRWPRVEGSHLSWRSSSCQKRVVPERQERSQHPYGAPGQ